VLPALQTKVPTMLATGPVVPIAFPPPSTSPSTKKNTPPVLKFTRAVPALVIHGSGPLEIPPTGLLMPGAVMTPFIFCQRTTDTSCANAADAENASNNIEQNFIEIHPFSFQDLNQAAL
jgi:hypothetical protein